MRKSPARKRFVVMLLLAVVLSSVPAYCQKPQKPAPQREVKDTTPAPAATISIGPYYALVIGNNNYRYLGKLETARNDATEMAKLLQKRYGFATPKLLLDATRDDIFTALTEYRRTLPGNSNLLIYYAGHGYHDRDTDEAYWLPVDAQSDNPDHWISANDITTNIRAIPSKHVLIISDSCYSGVLTRGADVAINPLERDAYLTKMLKSKSRNLMSSGGDEPVADSGAAGHSVFANAILKSLGEMEDEQFTAADLFQRFIKRRVAGRSDQVPQYSFIRNSGDEFGDFVFSRGRKEVVVVPDTGNRGVGSSGASITSGTLQPPVSLKAEANKESLPTLLSETQGSAPQDSDATSVRTVLDHYAEAVASGDLEKVKAVRQVRGNEEKKMIESLKDTKEKGFALRNCLAPEITGDNARVNCDVLLTRSKDTSPGHVTFFLKRIYGQWFILSSN